MFHKNLSTKFSQLMILGRDYEDGVAERINRNVSVWEGASQKGEQQDGHIWHKKYAGSRSVTTLLISKKPRISIDV